MAINKERKRELVAAYSEILQHTSGFVITEYRGMSVDHLDALRKVLRETDSAYVVTKNTLFKIALRETGWPIPEDLLVGPVATAFADGNMPGLMKSMLDYQEDNPDLFTLKGGVMGSSVLSVAELKAISELPSLDQLRAEITGLLVQPPTGLVSILDAPAKDLVGVVNAATSDLINVLNAYVQKEGGDEAA